MKVVYFSRTGVCKGIAEELAKSYGTSVVKIDDGMNWNGLFGYIKAGYFASTNKHIDVSTSEAIDKEETVIVVAPLWAGTIAPAAREYMRGRKTEKTALIVSSLGSVSKWPENRSSYLFVGDIVKKLDNLTTVLGSLDAALRSKGLI